MLAVVNASQIVTLAGPERARVGHEMGELGIVENGTLLVNEGKVVAVGPTRPIDAGLADQVIDARGMVITPGFVDAHTHAVFGGKRVEEFEMRCAGATYEAIGAAGGGIRSSMRATREATEEQLVEVGRRHARWFLSGGTTTIECKSGYGLSQADELKMLRAIRTLAGEGPLDWHATFLAAHAFPPEFEGDPEAYVNLIIESMLPAVTSNRLASWCDIFVERNYFSADHARRIMHAAREKGLGIRMHVDQLSNSGGAALAAEVGATTADHLEMTEADGIEAMAAAGVTPVLLPASVYALGRDRYPLARDMIEAGLPVVVATDFNPGSSPTASMPFVLSLACRQMGMSPAQAMTAATVNAARSLGLNDRGTLTPGSRADFALWACEDYREIVYWLGAPLMSRVFVQGQMVPL